MQGQQVLKSFPKSIGTLEFLIRTLENNLGTVERTVSPLVNKLGVSQTEFENVISQQREQIYKQAVKSGNTNVRNFVKEQEKKLQAENQQEEKPQQQQQQQKPQKQAKQQTEQKDQQVKKDKKQKQPKQQPIQEPETSESIFYNIDIRVGNIVEAAKHPESDKLYVEKIDVGGEIREIASGLQQFVPIEGMTGLCLVITNLKPRKIGGIPSNGMVLCTSNADKTQVEILRPPAGSKPGQRVFLEGTECPSEAPGLLNPKKKILENAILTTDENKVATYDNKFKWALPAGVIVSPTISKGTIS
ncbi:Nucleic acid-binding, OB-fold [Pseudocohnilembus persalinus]|uniref:Nucleic acid-binding, OB-fold n=1 Tax=Pseudocohnilembus persalinus TaxID=266149 RepID=A0A0V0R565_PSEPJ|nr:Nucleic acid-binding, OB-fold [Pseudocohnilembus persalinus]|eukprot:KRX09614.1 Nucleic acid-binding, OB-fold [Pseudocohnilembus persalinus]